MSLINPHGDFALSLSVGPVSVAQGAVLGMVIQGTTIVITPGQRGMDEMDTFIHETLHVTKPRLTEEEVHRMAGDIARVLWASGYRRKKIVRRKEP
jgi:hypothetical protein